MVCDVVVVRRFLHLAASANAHLEDGSDVDAWRPSVDVDATDDIFPHMSLPLAWSALQY
eukprot:COSAG04_NODE_19322_length_419_cov_0.612500_1_plen_58_part_10